MIRGLIVKASLVEVIISFRHIQTFEKSQSLHFIIKKRWHPTLRALVALHCWPTSSGTFHQLAELRKKRETYFNRTL